MSIELKVKRLHTNARLPVYKTALASGMDLYASEELSIPPGEIIPVPLGIALEIPQGYEGQIRPRSGLARAGYVGIFGTIDADYRGEVMAMLENRTSNYFLIRVGDRVAQLMIAPVTTCTPVDVVELSDTERGVGGFGSTGVR